MVRNRQTHQCCYVQGADVELGINATVKLTLVTLCVSAQAKLLCQPSQCIFPRLRSRAVASYELVCSVLLIERTNRHHQCFRHIFRSCLEKPKMINTHTLTSDYVSNWTDTSLFPFTLKTSNKSLTCLKMSSWLALLLFLRWKKTSQTKT